MKRILTLILILLSVSITQAQYSGTIHTRPLSPLFKNVTLAFEKTVSPEASFVIEGVYSWGGIAGFWDPESELFPDAIRITPEMRFYLAGREDAPVGFHIGPFARYSIDFINTTSYAQHTLGAGFSMGYQGVIGSTASMGFFLSVGLGYNIRNSTQIPSGYEWFFGTSVTRPLLRMGYTVGLAY